MKLKVEDKSSACNKLCKESYINSESTNMPDCNSLIDELTIKNALKNAYESFERNNSDNSKYQILLKSYETNFDFFIKRKELIESLADLAMLQGDFQKSIDIYFDLIIHYKNDANTILWNEKRALANIKAGNLLEAYRIFSKLEEKFPGYEKPQIKVKECKKGMRDEIKSYKFQFFKEK